MHLTDLPAVLMDDLVRTWRRRAIVGAIVGIFGLAAVIHGITAVRIALESAVGPIAAHLYLVGIFLGIVLIAIAVLVWAERRNAARREALNLLQGKQKIAVIAEAVGLGYALGRDFKRARAADAAAERQKGANAKARADAHATAP